MQLLSCYRESTTTGDIAYGFEFLLKQYNILQQTDFSLMEKVIRDSFNEFYMLQCGK